MGYGALYSEDMNYEIERISKATMFDPLEHHFSGLWWPKFPRYELKKLLRLIEIARPMINPFEHHFSCGGQVA